MIAILTHHLKVIFPYAMVQSVPKIDKWNKVELSIQAQR